jgi:flagellar hook-length control protein FliK
MKMIVHPEALGELRLKVGMKDGKVEVSVTAGSEEAAGMLRKSAQDLASSLGDKNLTLAKFDVQVSDKQVNASSDSRGGSMEHNLHQQSHQNAFNMMNGEDGRPTRSDYREQAEPGYRKVARARAESTSSVGSASRRNVNSQNRLDVVA